MSSPIAFAWRWLLFPALSLLLPTAALAAGDQTRPASAPVSIVIDPARPLQQLDGWGTSLCWWAKVAGGYADADRQRIADEIFDPDKGLGLNVVRYNIGGGEDPARSPLPFRAAVPGYEPRPGAWDWNADVNQRWMLQAAIARGANHLEAFSNSPPYWMTVSGSVTGAADGRSNLRPEAFPAFADYLATVVQHFRQRWNIGFDTLDPLNEPIANWWKLGGRQEGCHFSRPEQQRILELAGKALANQQLPTQLSASDENSVDDAVGSLAVLGDSAPPWLAQINTHTYQGSARPRLRAMAAARGRRLWVSEYGDNDPTGLQMSLRILIDMKQLRPAAWVMWQVADASRGWGLFRSRLANETYDWKVNEKFYVFENYTRFFRPGCQMIDVDDRFTLAAWNAEQRMLSIVTTNPESTERQLDFDLSRCGFVHAVATAYRTSETEQLQKQPLVKPMANHVLALAPPRSITTFVITEQRSSAP